MILTWNLVRLWRFPLVSTSLTMSMGIMVISVEIVSLNFISTHDELMILLTPGSGW